MKHMIILPAIMWLMPFPIANACPETGQDGRAVIESQWLGKKVAFLGDSITDKCHVGTDKCYWEYLSEILGIEAFSYGVNGNEMKDLIDQAELLHNEMGDTIDAIFIFAGTNDYNSAVPAGEWYDECYREVTVSGNRTEKRKYRTPVMSDSTFCGRINLLMDYLKTYFPDRQIILLTPLHRGYACFGVNNIQPEESYANACGAYFDEYLARVKEAGNVWSVPVIDLNSISGLYPLNDSQTIYFHDKDSDRLHPGSEGHWRMAMSIAYQLLAFPSDFRRQMQ